MPPAIIAMGIGPFLKWKRSDFYPALNRLKLAFLLSLLSGTTVWSYSTDESFIGIIGITLATWLGTSTLVEFAERINLFKIPFFDSCKRITILPRATWGMTFGHFGLAIVIAGITGASAWKTESIQSMKPGDSVNVAGYNYTFEGTFSGKGPNFDFLIGEFTVHKNGTLISRLKAEKRKYLVSGMKTTEAAIHPTLFGDLYAVIGEPDGPNGSFVTRLYFNPLVSWMWFGTLVMVIGGILSLTDFRNRIGFANRKKQVLFSS